MECKCKPETTCKKEALRQLLTIQTKENLNRVFSADEQGPGGANHEYVIVSDNNLQVPIEQKIVFQKGPRKEEGSQHGVIDSDLLEIVRDRLKAFQAGPYASEYNECALANIEEALTWLNKRVEDRIAKGILGTSEKDK